MLSEFQKVFSVGKIVGILLGILVVLAILNPVRIIGAEERGLFPIIQNINNGYAICESITKYENIRVSEFCKSKKDLGLGGGYTYRNQEIEKENWKIVGFYDIPFKPFEVGDKVDIREDLADIYDVSDWHRTAAKMIGQNGLEIKDVFNDSSGLHYSVYTKNKSDYYYFRHEWLRPSLEDRLVCQKCGTELINVLNEKDMSKSRVNWCPECGDDRTIEDVLAGLSEEDKEIVRRSLK